MRVKAAQIQPGDLVCSLLASVGNPIVRFRFSKNLVSDGAFICREFLFEASLQEWAQLLSPWDELSAGGLACGQIKSDKFDEYQDGAIVLTKPLVLMPEVEAQRCVLISLVHEKAGDVEVSPQLAISADVVLPPLLGVLLSQGLA